MLDKMRTHFGNCQSTIYITFQHFIRFFKKIGKQPLERVLVLRFSLVEENVDAVNADTSSSVTLNLASPIQAIPKSKKNLGGGENRMFSRTKMIENITL